jgi:hypothetical protein
MKIEEKILKVVTFDDHPSIGIRSDLTSSYVNNVLSFFYYKFSVRNYLGS